jgi:chemotaxis protein MotB
MVEPTGRCRLRPALGLLTAALALTGGLSGCGMVPKSRMDECRRVAQTLRAENNRLKDVALDLRAQNQDLSERAVDDARQIAARDEANERLVRSVHAYQAERDKLAEAFASLERQVRMAVNPHPAARPTALKAFAAAHPSWSFDEPGMALSAPPAALFEKGTDALTPDAVSALKDLSAELSGAGAGGLALEVAGPVADAPPPVVAAGHVVTRNGGGADVAAASGRVLAAARAARVRDRIVTETGLAPSRVRLAPPPAGDEGRIEVRIAGAPAPALDSGPAPAR